MIDVSLTILAIIEALFSACEIICLVPFLGKYLHKDTIQGQ